MYTGPEPAPSEPLAAPRFRRAGPLVLLAIAAALLYFLAPHWPHDQRVRVSLGELAPRVTSVDLEYAPDNAAHDSESAHVASFHFAPGQAPRIVEHAPNLPNGHCRIDLVIELVNPTDRLDLTRNVTLDENTVTLPVEAGSK